MCRTWVGASVSARSELGERAAAETGKRRTSFRKASRSARTLEWGLVRGNSGILDVVLERPGAPNEVTGD